MKIKLQSNNNATIVLHDYKQPILGKATLIVDSSTLTLLSKLEINHHVSTGLLSYDEIPETIIPPKAETPTTIVTDVPKQVDLASMTVAEIKQAVLSNKLNGKDVLASELNNKNRSSLISWLQQF